MTKQTSHPYQAQQNQVNVQTKKKNVVIILSACRRQTAYFKQKYDWPVRKFLYFYYEILVFIPLLFKFWWN